MNNTSDRITLLESTDGEIRITATEQKIFIVTPFNAEFKDQLKARFGARWNGSTREWSIPLRYRDELDPLLYDFYGVSMIAEVTTPSLMKVAINAQRLYQVSGAGSEINLAGSRVAVRWGRDEAVKVYRGVFKKDGEDFRFPRSGGSMRRPRVAGCGELDGAVLETEITPAELDWLRENEIHFELLDGGESAEPQPEDPQLDPEDMDSIHEDDETWMEDDDDEDRVYVQEEEEPAEAEVEVETKSDEDKEENEMKKNMKDTEDFMAIDPVTMDDRKEMEMETKMNEDRIAETKARAFTTPTNEAVVKAWDAFDQRVMDVYDPDTYVRIERGSRQVLGIGGAGDIIRGIDMRKDRQTMECELDAWMKVSDFMGDVFPSFSNPDADKALLLVEEWNDLMDAITHDYEEASPDVRQAAEDQKIVALGRQNGSVIGMEVYDDGVDVDEILRLRKYDASAAIINTYTSSAGVHEATYAGWTGDDNEIIYAGGYVNGSFVRSDEVYRAGLLDKLSEDVKAEMEPQADGSPVFWNDKILEIQDDVDPRDAELLEALWIGAAVYDGVVTVYGVDDGVTKMDEDDFKILGLHRCIDQDYDVLG